jgi:hypothetical protein
VRATCTGIWRETTSSQRTLICEGITCSTARPMGMLIIDGMVSGSSSIVDSRPLRRSSRMLPRSSVRSVSSWVREPRRVMLTSLGSWVRSCRFADSGGIAATTLTGRVRRSLSAPWMKA